MCSLLWVRVTQARSVRPNTPHKLKKERKGAIHKATTTLAFGACLVSRYRDWFKNPVKESQVKSTANTKI